MTGNVGSDVDTTTTSTLINSIVQKIFGQKEVPVESWIAKVEKTTKLRRDQIAYIIVGILAVYFIIISAAQVIFICVGIIYPLCKTVKTFSPTSSLPSSLEQTKWFTYWTIFAAFSVFDVIGIPLFGSFYYLAKSAALFYLYISPPQQREQGQPPHDHLSKVYESFVKPLAAYVETNVLEKLPIFNKTE